MGRRNARKRASREPAAIHSNKGRQNLGSNVTTKDHSWLSGPGVAVFFTYSALVIGATWQVATATWTDRFDALNRKTYDMMDRQKQFMELWEQELERGFQENLDALHEHDEIVLKIMDAIVERNPDDEELLQLRTTLATVQQDNRASYEEALRSLRDRKREWQMLVPPR